jgi:hypothetical protein
VLGSIIDPKVLGTFHQMSACQQCIDAARETLNALVMTRRSLAMTINELSDMKIDMSSLKNELQQLNDKITQAANRYLSVRIENEEKLQGLRVKSNSSGEETETKADVYTEPVVDFLASKLLSQPLSAESLNMDSQYFSFGSNMEDDMLANIEKFIRSSTGNLSGISDKTAKEVSTQITTQFQNHSISGTLIIVASCTHQNVRLFEPLIVDPDKAVQAWNMMYADDRIDTSTEQAPNDGNDAAGKTISIISGASYGSSFVGMVHILNSDSKKSGDFEQLKQGFEEKLRIGGWLADTVGGFGVDEAAIGDVKAFLSSQSVNCHISIVSMGVVPSINSKALSLGVRSMSSVDEKTINTVLYPEKQDKCSTESHAYSARQSALLLSISNERVAQIMRTLNKIDHERNNVMDVNSLMDAFENYISLIKGKSAIVGIPINYFIKRLTKGEIIELWKKRNHFTENNAGNVDEIKETKKGRGQP